MTNQDIVKAILSKDTARIAEAKTAIKTMLDTRAGKFRADASKFVAKSLFSESVNESFGGIHATPAAVKDQVKYHKAQAQVHSNLAGTHAVNRMSPDHKSNAAHTDAMHAHYDAHDAHISAANRYRAAGASPESNRVAAEADSKTEHAHGLTAKTKSTS